MKRFQSSLYILSYKSLYSHIKTYKIKQYLTLSYRDSQCYIIQKPFVCL